MGERDQEGVVLLEPPVSVDWLAEHLDDPDLRVFDATVQISTVLFPPRIRTGQRDYRRGHIPGSAFLDLFKLHDRDRSRLSKTAPTASHFAGAVGGLGIGNHAYVESVAPWEEKTDDPTDDPHSDGHRGSR